MGQIGKEKIKKVLEKEGVF